MLLCRISVLRSFVSAQRTEETSGCYGVSSEELRTSTFVRYFLALAFIRSIAIPITPANNSFNSARSFSVAKKQTNNVIIWFPFLYFTKRINLDIPSTNFMELN
jgi:hypothetical protein